MPQNFGDGIDPFESSDPSGVVVKAQKWVGTANLKTLRASLKLEARAMARAGGETDPATYRSWEKGREPLEGSLNQFLSGLVDRFDLSGEPTTTATTLYMRLAAFLNKATPTSSLPWPFDKPPPWKPGQDPRKKRGRKQQPRPFARNPEHTPVAGTTSLEPREREILRQHLGLTGYTQKPIAEIAKTFGTTEQAISATITGAAMKVSRARLYLELWSREARMNPGPNPDPKEQQAAEAWSVIEWIVNDVIRES